MAANGVVIRTCGSIIVIFFAIACHAKHIPPSIKSFSVTELNNDDGIGGKAFAGKIYALQLQGDGFFGSDHKNMQLVLTNLPDRYGASCNERGLIFGSVKLIESSDDKCTLKVYVPDNKINDVLYFCLKTSNIWVHQGDKLAIAPARDANLYISLNEYADNSRKSLPLDVEGQMTQDFDDAAEENLIHNSIQYEDNPEIIYAYKNAEKVNRISLDDPSFQKLSQMNIESNDVHTYSEDIEKNLKERDFLQLKKQSQQLDDFDGANVINEYPEEVQKYLSDNSIEDSFQDLLQNENDQFVIDSEEQGVLNNKGKKPHMVSNVLKESIGNSEVVDSSNREPLKHDSDADFYGDLDQVTDKMIWIDLSHDIDVNYDDGVQQGSDISDDTVATYRYKYLADEDDENKNAQADDSSVGLKETIKDIKVVKKSDKAVKKNEKLVDNTWDGFKEAASSPRAVPKHWIDLSHDIDVNYPSVDSGIVLDVEGVDVDKNIYDKSEKHEEIETGIGDEVGVPHKKVSEVDDMGFGGDSKIDIKSEVIDGSNSETREELSDSKAKELEIDGDTVKKDINSRKTVLNTKTAESSPVIENSPRDKEIHVKGTLSSKKVDEKKPTTFNDIGNDKQGPDAVTIPSVVDLANMDDKPNDDLVVQFDDYDFVKIDLTTAVGQGVTEGMNVKKDAPTENQKNVDNDDKFLESYSRRKLLSLAFDPRNAKFNDLNSIHDAFGDSTEIDPPNPDDPDFMTSDFFKTNIRDRREITSDSGKEDVSKDGFESKSEKDELRGTTVSDAFDRIGNDNEAKSETVMPAASNSLLGFGKLKIESIRVEESSRDLYTESEGVPELLADTETVIRIFGEGIGEDTLIIFTHDVDKYGGQCQFPATGFFTMEKGSVSEKFATARARINLPAGVTTSSTFYICAKRATLSGAESSNPYAHQGGEPWLRLRTYAKLLPLWASMCIICTCLLFSALFSGLNLGLMSLDRTELKILCNTGTENEKKHARTIQPVRDHGNYLLCSILLGNVAVNSTFTILLDDLTSGLFAVIFSTLSIVLLGEITPQAICSRHGLAVGAHTINVTKAVMAITFPLSYPVSLLLDFLLGEEIGNVYNRERLKELVKVTTDINDLDRDEVNIISGALEMRKKTVNEVMTKIEDVFMLDYDAVLDFETVSEIMKTGYSRIPVYEGSRTNIIAMLYIKDLAFVDPDDNTPLRTLCQFYQNPCNFVFEDVTLDVIFKQFKEGHKGHMAFVQRVNNEGEGDPFYETVGLVTLEDVIEELIQAEIMDETDVFTDNKSKRRRMRPPNKLQDFGVFAERRENQRIRISPQLTLATFQYLSTVDAFKPDVVSETILRRMLKQDIIHHIKFRSKERQKTDPTTLIYEQGKPVDYFVLILEGRVEVTVGKEKLVFESGPFTYFGSQALMQNVTIAESPVVPPSALGSLQSINMDAMIRYTFIPDYSVRAITEVFYVTIKRSLYLAAKRATLMERCAGGGRHKGSDDAGEQFDDEVEKLLHSLEEEGSPLPTRSPSHHMNSHHVSPLGPNGSVHTSRQHSPTKSNTHIDNPLHGVDTHSEDSALLPHS